MISKAFHFTHILITDKMWKFILKRQLWNLNSIKRIIKYNTLGGLGAIDINSKTMIFFLTNDMLFNGSVVLSELYKSWFWRRIFQIFICGQMRETNQMRLLLRLYTDINFLNSIGVNPQEGKTYIFGLNTLCLNCERSR